MAVILKPFAEAWERVETIMVGGVEMAIAVFVDVKANVDPKSVKYGDKPVDFTVVVVSVNPFDEAMMKKLIACMKASLMKCDAPVGTQPLDMAVEGASSCATFAPRTT